MIGTWTRRAASDLDEKVTWKVGANGALSVHRASKSGASDDPPRTLAFLRERQLGIKTGTSTQFVPALVGDDEIRLAWTSGALVVPMTDDKSFMLPDAGRDRWLVWRGSAPCKLVDPQRGAVDVPCGFQGSTSERFGYRDTFDGGREIVWERTGKLLVPPGMELLVRSRAARGRSWWP